MGKKVSRSEFVGKFVGALKRAQFACKALLEGETRPNKAGEVVRLSPKTGRYGIVVNGTLYVAEKLDLADIPRLTTLYCNYGL